MARSHTRGNWTDEVYHVNKRKKRCTTSIDLTPINIRCHSQSLRAIGNTLLCALLHIAFVTRHRHRCHEKSPTERSTLNSPHTWWTPSIAIATPHAPADSNVMNGSCAINIEISRHVKQT